jgi:CheY-like chemotaxis protein
VDGASGLTTLEEHAAVISLVLLDMAMPEMSGKDVLTRIRASGAAVLVAIFGGYSKSEDSPCAVDRFRLSRLNLLEAPDIALIGYPAGDARNFSQSPGCKWNFLAADRVD